MTKRRAGVRARVAMLGALTLGLASVTWVAVPATAATISGTAGADTLTGTDDDDVMSGLASDDRLDGLRGSDTLLGDTGADRLYGGLGADDLQGGDDIDSLHLGTGTTTHYPVSPEARQAMASEEDSGPNTASGGAGKDYVWGAKGADIIMGGEGDDVLAGFQGADHIDGGPGDDVLCGGGQAGDVLVGGPGIDLPCPVDDSVVMPNGATVTISLPKNDSVLADEADETEPLVYDRSTSPSDAVSASTDRTTGLVTLTAHAQTYPKTVTLRYVVHRGWHMPQPEFLLRVTITGPYSPPAAPVPPDPVSTVPVERMALHAGEHMFGSPYADHLMASAGNEILSGLAGNDWLQGLPGHDTIWGGPGDDNIAGDAGNDLLYGEAGKDGISGGQGDDFMHGGSSDDTMAGHAGYDTLDGADGDDLLTGGDEDDVLRGGGDNDTLRGDDGEDWLDGEAGDDVLCGNDGDDRLIGGPGTDLACAVDDVVSVDADSEARIDVASNDETLLDEDQESSPVSYRLSPSGLPPWVTATIDEQTGVITATVGQPIADSLDLLGSEIPTLATNIRYLVTRTTSTGATLSSEANVGIDVDATTVELGVAKGPSVSGAPQVGQELSAHAPAFVPSATDTTYEWLRGSTAVAQGSSYKLTTADVGKQVTVRAVGRREPYVETAAEALSGTVAKARPNVRASVSALGGRRVRITVAVTATGLTPTGRVTIRRGSKIVASNRLLQQGRVVVTLSSQPKVRTRYSVTYSGSSAVSAKSVWTAFLRIR